MTRKGELGYLPKMAGGGQTIDFHAHVFPDYLGKLLPPSVSREPIDQVRRNVRKWMKPFSTSLHRASTFVRHLPMPLRERFDQISSLAPLPGLLVESTPADLLATMRAKSVSQAVVIANPYAPSEWVLELAEEHPEFIPAVVVKPGTVRPGQALKSLFKKGARVLKIHPAMDGEGVDSTRYHALLKAAADVGLPVILHTGCFHMHLFFKDPHQGQAQRFAPWFKEFSEVRFILAHMNYHEPNIALDLSETYENVSVDTSWQPAEIIGEAVRRLGAEKVFFGSDWPIAGHNLSVGIGRVQDCLDSGMILKIDAEKILGGNARSVLGLEGETRAEAP